MAMVRLTILAALLAGCADRDYGIVAEVLERGSRGALLEDGPKYRVALEDGRRVDVCDLAAVGDCVEDWSGVKGACWELCE